MKPTNLEKLRDEAGIALALAIIVVVVAGVMGAGLLLVVRKDLEAVISTNNARRAFYAADAGAQLARRHILSDPRISSYDDAPGPEDCRPPATDETREDSPWSYSTEGVTRAFGGGEFTTEILALGDGCGVPEPRPGERYFRAFSEGRFGEARRLVEATYVTRDIGAPLAVYAAGDVLLGPQSAVSGGSVFAGGDVTVSSGATVSGEDRVYGGWASEDRRANEGESPSATGATGATGTIGAAGTVSGAESPFYDSTTDPAFVASEPSSGEVSYPFEPGFWEDRDNLAFMEEEAKRQDNYREQGDFGWPGTSSGNTVVYVDMEEPEPLALDVATCPEVCRGTLIADGGGVVVEPGVGFSGVIVSAGGSGEVVVEEDAAIEGFVVSDGDVEIGGGVEAPGPGVGIRPGHFGVEVFNWREPPG